MQLQRTHLPVATRAVLFDLDGTLVDSIGDLTLATDRTLAALAFPTAGEARVRTWVGRGLEQLLTHALEWALGGERERWDDTWASAWPEFLRQYEQANGRTVRPLPGAIEIIRQLGVLGMPMAVVTNKARPFTLPLLADLGWDEMFSAVVCGDDTARKKPAPDPLLRALELLSTPTDAAVMIGDSDNDVAAARAAGIWSARVRGGYGPAGKSVTANLEDTTLTELCCLFR